MIEHNSSHVEFERGDFVIVDMWLSEEAGIRYQIAKIVSGPTREDRWSPTMYEVELTSRDCSESVGRGDIKCFLGREIETT